MSYSKNILVVDDEKYQREILAEILSSEGFDVQTARDGHEALSIIHRGGIDLVLTDQKMGSFDGFSLLKSVVAGENQPLVILITAFGTIDLAVDAIKIGAFDYLTKPINKEELLVAVKQAFENIDLRKQNTRLKEELYGKGRIESIIGSSGAMLEIFKIVRKVAVSNATVLVRGESGTGKELIARAIHNLSPRRLASLCSINCAAIPDTLLESELFGYEKGAFTGADSRKEGLFETANNGTIFLDEIGDLSLPLQAKILRAIQERCVRRLGGKEEIKINVRIVAATNKNLEKEMKDGRFREDLYYRLNIVGFIVPPLRERKTDIPLLLEHFLSKHAEINKTERKKISPKALNLLMQYSWPGNVRQLESVIERALVLCDGLEIKETDLPVEVSSKAFVSATLPDVSHYSLEEMEKTALVKAMEGCGWVMARAARKLGVTYRTLQYRLDKYNIRKREELNQNV